MPRRLKVNVEQLIAFLNQRKQKETAKDSEANSDDWSQSVWGEFAFDPAADESWSSSLSGIASYESHSVSSDDA